MCSFAACMVLITLTMTARTEVALAIARAIEDPATPFRVPVGQDAEMILGLRRTLDDQALEDALRKALGITW